MKTNGYNDAIKKRNQLQFTMKDTSISFHTLQRGIWCIGKKERERERENRESVSAQTARQDEEKFC